MADDQTKIIISIDTVLKNLDRTLKGLSAIERQLKSIGTIKGGQANFDKVTAQAQRLANQQARLAVQTQELTNRQERARQQADRLALSQLKLEQSFSRLAKAEAKTASASVKQAQDRDQQVRRINEQTAKQAEEQEALRAKAAKTIADVQTREAKRGATAIIQGLEESRERSQAFAKTIESVGNSLRSVGQGLTSLGFSLSAVLTAPLVALASSATDASLRLDSLKLGLKAIVGSGEEAERQLRRLTEVAKLPGIGFEEAIQGSIRLQAVGFSAKDAEKALREFSNAIALTGGGRDELNRVTVQLGQLAAKGKVLSQDLRPIIEAAPAVGKALKQAFGTVNADDIAEISGTSEEFLKTLIAQLEQLPRAAGGARNAFENFRDSIFRASTALGDALLPILTRLADIALPIIQFIAEGFRALPFPIQAAIVALGGVAAALGPVLVVSGLLLLSIGRLAVGFAQLSLEAGGVAGAMTAMSVAMAEARVVATGLLATLRGIAAPAAAIVLILGIVASAFFDLSEAEKEAKEVDEEAEKARTARIAGLKSEIESLEKLVGKTSRTTAEEELLIAAYKGLNEEQLKRIQFIENEKDKIEALIDAKRRQLEIDEFIARGTISQQQDEIVRQIKAEIEALQRREQARKDERNSSARAFQGQINETRTIITETERLGRIEGARTEALNRGVQAQEDMEKAQIAAGKAIAILARIQGKSTDEIIEQLRASRLNSQEFQFAKDAVDAFAHSQENATPKVDRLTDSLEAQANQLRLLFLNDPLVKEAKSADAALDGLIENLRITSGNAEGARLQLKAFIEQIPLIKKAVERAGGFDKVIDKILGVKAIKDSGTSLRNALERFAEQQKDLAEARRNQTRATEEAAGEDLLRVNELNFTQRLNSYREYLTKREELTTKALDKEISVTETAIKKAQERADELRKAATIAGIPQVERVNRQTQAAKADQEAIQAQTKLIELQSKRKDVVNDTARALEDAANQQERAIRELQIDAGKLRGDLETALKAEAALPILERLQELARDQDFITRRLRDNTKQLTGEQKAELLIAQQRNAVETDLRLKQLRTADALAVLTAHEKNVTDAKEEQRNLEEDIAFQVDFRGLKERDALRARLAGEEQLKQTLLINRDIVQGEIDALIAEGRIVPEELQKFVEQINRDVQSLGKLPFAEQFRIAEEEFNRINDERLAKIAEVEDAINRRTIAEVQGLLKIRLINADYQGDLEEQSRLLTEIAKQSNNPQLIQRARQVQQTTRDANTELEDFNTRLRSVSIDALQEGLSNFFSDLADNTKTAKERLLDFINSVTRSITDFIARDFSRQIIESIFGTGQQGAATGFIATIKRLLGIGGGESVKAVEVGTEAAGKAVDTAQITAAATALSTAGVTTATAISTAGVALTTGAAAITAGISAAGSAFAGQVSPAGIAFVTAAETFAAAVAVFAAAVGASSTASIAQTAGSLGSSLGGAFGAATGMFPATPGGIVRIVEGGYPEAVLTTDPKHAAQQVNILRHYLKETKGLFGRIPGFAQGGFDIARDAEAEMLQSLSASRSSIPAPSPSLQPLVAGGDTNLRILNLLDKRQLVGGHLRSAEGARDIMNIISENASEVSRRISIR